MKTKKNKIAVFGLGYVGLPLAISFAKKFEVIGYDISKKRIDELNAGFDITGEVSGIDLEESSALFSNNIDDIRKVDFFIVTVPTPVDNKNTPDISLLISACHDIAKIISKGACVIFESTVYPGCTEQDCIPVIEKGSGLKYKEDFHIGYSPERINPGDQKHNFENINKVVSGSSAKAEKLILNLYSSVIKAEIFVAKSIMAAEAAKVLENTQRDINIALMNEVSEICEKLNLNTFDVLEAAKTKWNFLDFRPGLVGGHCIGVDPYYLAYQSKRLGVKPRVILSGRLTNTRVANRIIKYVNSSRIKSKRLQVTILGITFKENCPDIRNSGSISVLKGLNKSGIVPNILDPYFKEDPCIKNANYNFVDSIKKISKNQDFILILTPHTSFQKIHPNKLRELIKKNGQIFDMTNFFKQADFKAL